MPANTAGSTGNTGNASTTGAKSKGGAKLKSQSKGSNIQSMVLLIFFPWILFIIIMATWVIWYHHHWLVTIFTILGGLMLSIGLITLSLGGDKANHSGKPGGKRWYAYLGVVCFIATLTGTVLGFYLYHTFIFQYNSYEERRMYANVLPSEPASTKVDAGKMVFATDARVDVSRSIGFKAGSFYCVAPILDEDMDTRVEYWAAGVDCCSYRGDFSCDDAWDPRARSGAVLFEDSSELIPSIRPFFEKARIEAEAAYNMASSDEAIFVKWTRDPDAVQERYWKSGMGYLTLTTCVYLVISIMFGAGLAYLNAKTK
jgi:hypothetical protein